MTVAEGIASILLWAVNLGLAFALISWCRRKYRVDVLRYRLFVRRDELFDLALNTHGRFQPPRMHETGEGWQRRRAVARFAGSGGGCKIGSLSGGKGRDPRQGRGPLPRHLN